jgi:hypothetical protein
LSNISPLHSSAREYAAAGWPVFPCLPGSKIPATENGFEAATTDIEIIDKWWAQNPDYNPACPIHQAGMSVIDLDGPAGIAAWEKLKDKHNAPDTYEVQTPRGRHLYFQGDLPSSAWAPGRERCLGEHIDTRGVGGYVLLPPAVITSYEGADAIHNGKQYRVRRNIELAPVPDWCRAALAQHLAPARATQPLESDAAGNLDRARTRLLSLIASGDVAYSGRGGNNRTYEVATELHELGLSETTAFEFLREIYNPHCSPPWGDTELAEIVANAYRYAQNEAGAFAVAPAAEVFAQALDKLPAEMKQQAPRSRFYFEDDAEQDTAKDPTWLIPEIVPDAATVLVIGATGSFKSFLTQHMLLALAAGRNFGGIKPVRFGPTFYGAHEGRNELKKSRKQAWKLVHQVSGAIPFFVAPAPHVAIMEECDEFREQIRVRLRQSRTRIAGIVLDTVAKCMVGLNENDAKDIGVFVGFCDSLRDEFECSVIALHHLGKDEQRGSRGSSALQAGFDTTLKLKRAGERSKLVQLEVVQHKDAEERETPFTFEGKKVGSTLVFQPVTIEQYKASMTADDPFTKQKVGKALQEIGAKSLEAAVSAAVLFDQLVPATQEQTTEDRERQVNAGAARLKALARGDLQAYCVRDGRELYWFLPG